MKKVDLIGIVANKAHLTKKGAKESIETLVTEIQKALSNGEKLLFLVLVLSRVF